MIFFQGRLSSLTKNAGCRLNQGVIQVEQTFPQLDFWYCEAPGIFESCVFFSDSAGAKKHPSSISFRRNHCPNMGKTFQNSTPRPYGWLKKALAQLAE